MKRIAVMPAIMLVAGCGFHAQKEAPQTSSPQRFVPTQNDEFTAVDTHTGQLCLTYSFAKENQIISHLRSEPNQGQHNTLENMQPEMKERILRKLREPDNLPICSDLAKNS